VPATTADKLMQCDAAFKILSDELMVDDVRTIDAKAVARKCFDVLVELWDTAYQAGRDDR
jgi:hypothetical protein